jgi:hypothetical protein
MIFIVANFVFCHDILYYYVKNVDRVEAWENKQNKKLFQRKSKTGLDLYNNRKINSFFKKRIL